MCSGLRGLQSVNGNNMGNDNNNHMYGGLLCRELDESINNALKQNGSCDKEDLPWLLATYVSEGKKHRRERQKKRACQNGHVYTDQ